MKSSLLVLSLAFSLFFPGRAGAIVAGESIPSFESTITFFESGKIGVSEHITYDFGETRRHGIYRNIPYRYHTNGPVERITEIADIRIDDPSLAALPEYAISEEQDGDYQRLRIGDPELYVVGIHEYPLYYTVDTPMNEFDSHQELYWNVTGDQWEVSIGQASARVILPEGVLGDDVRTACFVGPAGSTAPCDSISFENNAVVFSHNHELPPGSGFTIVLGLPPGTLTIPYDSAEDIWYAAFLLPLFTFFIMFIWWFRRGRDHKGRGTILTQFDGGGYSPAMASLLLKDRVTGTSLSAEIIRLAVDGFLTIHRVVEEKLGKDSVRYILERRGAAQPEEKERAILLDLLFQKPLDEEEVKSLTISVARGATLARLDTLSTDAHEKMQEVRELVLGEAKAKQFLKHNPVTVRAVSLLVGVFILIAGASSPFPPQIILTGVIILFFGWHMPALLKEGVHAREYLLGLKRYIRVAEKDRIAFHNAPEKSPKLFETLLPYAMVFGLEKKWGKEFAGIYIEKPTWYRGGNLVNGMYAASITSDLRQFGKTASSALATQASSGKSGFSGGHSGGGFGGGGGGSW